MELYTLTWMETRRSTDSQTSTHEVWYWQVEKNCEIQMFGWKVNWTNLYANSKTLRSTVIGRFYGTSFAPGKGFSG